MKVICHPDQRLHYPPGFLVNGVFRPNPEVQERYDRLLEQCLMLCGKFRIELQVQ